MENDNTKIIYCSSDSSDLDVEIIDEIDITNNELECTDELEDNISINEEKKKTLPINTMLKSEKLSTNNYDANDDDDDDDDDDEPWAVEEDSSDNSDFPLMPLNVVHMKNNENNLNTLETERKILTANRKLNNSSSSSVGSKTFCNNKAIDKDSETETEPCITTSKKMKALQVLTSSWILEEMDINLKLDINNSEKDTKSINYKQGCTVPSSDVSNLIETTTFSDPSCSKDLPSPSNLSTSAHSPGSFILKSTDINSIMEREQESKLLFNFYNKSYLNGGQIDQILEKNSDFNQEDIRISTLEECDLVKNELKNTASEKNNEESQTIQSEGFVDGPNIIDSDIMYNIDLNEHLTYMDLLVQKIEKTPNDPTVLEECMQLLPIPQIEHEPKTYTIEERTNFLNGIAEWEYEIDKENWNKIMVKCAAVITAHAGFTIANEESLYVLADLAMDYIKKLAVIMKNNFDIQSRSSYPEKIDPINNSLQEIGVEGGVKELINNFENDVFGKQNRMKKKCQHFQKIIDQYIESMLEDSAVNSQCAAKQNTGDDTLNSQQFKKKDENLVLKEQTTEMVNTIEEVATDIQHTLEFNIDNLLITDANACTSTVSEQTECVENSNVETENKSIAKIDKIIEINLLKPIITEPIDYKPESILHKTQESMFDLEYEKMPNLFSNRSIFNIEGFGQQDQMEQPKENNLFGIKNKKMTQLITLENLLDGLCKSESEVPSKCTLELQKDLDEFDVEFEQYKASQITTDSSDLTTLADICCKVYNHVKLPENVVNDGASTSKEDDTHNISVLNKTYNDGLKTQYDSFVDGLLNKLE